MCVLDWLCGTYISLVIHIHGGHHGLHNQSTHECQLKIIDEMFYVWIEKPRELLEFISLCEYYVCKIAKVIFHIQCHLIGRCVWQLQLNHGSIPAANARQKWKRREEGRGILGRHQRLGCFGGPELATMPKSYISTLTTQPSMNIVDYSSSAP